MRRTSPAIHMTGISDFVQQSHNFIMAVVKTAAGDEGQQDHRASWQNADGRVIDGPPPGGWNRFLFVRRWRFSFHR
jgi:hypothetical protein